jgi:hypothetical protein
MTPQACKNLRVGDAVMLNSGRAVRVLCLVENGERQVLCQVKFGNYILNSPRR